MIVCVTKTGKLMHLRYKHGPKTLCGSNPSEDRPERDWDEFHRCQQCVRAHRSLVPFRPIILERDR